jgi:hypothetical protein
MGLTSKGNRAGDGNRTRMTSSEGFEYGGARQRERRSDQVSACPSVTVNSPRFTVRSARSGTHAHPPPRCGAEVAWS